MIFEFKPTRRALANASVEKEVKRILAAPKPLKIAYTVRLGYAAAAPARTLRVHREIEDCSGLDATCCAPNQEALPPGAA